MQVTNADSSQFQHEDLESAATSEESGAATPDAAPSSPRSSLPELDDTLFRSLRRGVDPEQIAHLAALYKIHQDIITHNGGLNLDPRAAQSDFETFITGVNCEWSPEETEVNPWLVARMNRNRCSIKAREVTVSMRIAKRVDNLMRDNCFRREYDERRTSCQISLTLSSKDQGRLQVLPAGESPYLQGSLTLLENSAFVFTVSWVREGLFLPISIGGPPSPSVLQSDERLRIEWMTCEATWPQQLMGKFRVQSLHNLYEYNSIVGLLIARRYLREQANPFVGPGDELQLIHYGRANKLCTSFLVFSTEHETELPSHYLNHRQGCADVRPRVVEAD